MNKRLDLDDIKRRNSCGCQLGYDIYKHAGRCFYTGYCVCMKFREDRSQLNNLFICEHLHVGNKNEIIMKRKRNRNI